jgi:hypothetical protein
MGVPVAINPCSDAARGPKVNTFVTLEECYIIVRPY